MNKITTLLLSLTLLLGIGCGSLLPSPPQELTYFRVATQPQVDLTNIEESSATAIDVSILVREQTNNSFLNSRRLVFAPSELERFHYQFARWVDTPPRQITKALSEKLIAEGLYKGVSIASSGTLSDLIVNVSLEEFYHDTSSQPGQGIATAHIELIDAQSRAILAETTLNERKPASSYSAKGAVEALSAASNSLISKMSSWIYRSAKNR